MPKKAQARQTDLPREAKGGKRPGFGGMCERRGQQKPSQRLLLIKEFAWTGQQNAACLLISFSPQMAK